MLAPVIKNSNATAVKVEQIGKSKSVKIEGVKSFDFKNDKDEHVTAIDGTTRNQTQNQSKEPAVKSLSRDLNIKTDITSKRDYIKNDQNKDVNHIKSDQDRGSGASSAPNCNTPAQRTTKFNILDIEKGDSNMLDSDESSEHSKYQLENGAKNMETPQHRYPSSGLDFSGTPRMQAMEGGALSSGMIAFSTAPAAKNVESAQQSTVRAVVSSNLGKASASSDSNSIPQIFVNMMTPKMNPSENTHAPAPMPAAFKNISLESMTPKINPSETTHAPAPMPAAFKNISLDFMTPKINPSETTHVPAPMPAGLKNLSMDSKNNSVDFKNGSVDGVITPLFAAITPKCATGEGASVPALHPHGQLPAHGSHTNSDIGSLTLSNAPNTALIDGLQPERMVSILSGTPRVNPSDGAAHRPPPLAPVLDNKDKKLHASAIPSVLLNLKRASPNMGPGIPIPLPGFHPGAESGGSTDCSPRQTENSFPITALTKQPSIGEGPKKFIVTDMPQGIAQPNGNGVPVSPRNEPAKNRKCIADV